MRLTILGSGASYGVPIVGCRCPACSSPDPRNQRLRAAAWFQVEGRSFLVDTPPELRLEALRSGLNRVDAVLYTHYHADHVNGIDDLKGFNAIVGGPLPCYGNAEMEAALRRSFSYTFTGTPYIGAIPHITFEPVVSSFDLLGVRVIPVELEHGRIESTGWRIGNAAYLTDCSRIPSASMDLLRGLDVLVIDGLRPRPHPTHFSISQAIEATRCLKPRRTILTHLNHDVEHNAISATLPADVELAYDGQTIRIEN